MKEKLTFSSTPSRSRPRFTPPTPRCNTNRGRKWWLYRRRWQRRGRPILISLYSLNSAPESPAHVNRRWSVAIPGVIITDDAFAGIIGTPTRGLATMPFCWCGHRSLGKILQVRTNEWLSFFFFLLEWGKKKKKNVYQIKNRNKVNLTKFICTV